jgi:hypothetical protein
VIATFAGVSLFTLYATQTYDQARKELGRRVTPGQADVLILCFPDFGKAMSEICRWQLSGRKDARFA